jgi:hypothetical protein
MAIKKSESTWMGYEEFLEHGSEISVQLAVDDGTVYLTLNKTGGKKKGIRTIGYTTTKGFQGNIDLFKFKIKKPQGRFPFELDSFEVNAGFIKGKFTRKKD